MEDACVWPEEPMKLINFFRIAKRLGYLHLGAVDRGGVFTNRGDVFVGAEYSAGSG